MRKEGIIFCIILLSVLNFASADEASDVQDGYNCLISKIESQNCMFPTVEQKAFSLLALDDNALCKSKILADKKNDLCWGKTQTSSCDIKSTAQAILSLYKAGEDVSKQADWLYSQQMVPTGIDWFLQIESAEPVTCTVTPYESSSVTISIGADKKISGGNLGACISIYSPSNYWLKINRDCYNKEFQIECDKSFLTNLLYKDGASPTVFVSSETHTAGQPIGSQWGKTFESIKSLCFKNGNTCDYEGGLWAAMVLRYVDRDYNIGPFVPYLMAGSTKLENEKYLPASFLYSITADNDFYLQILGHRKFMFNEYWDVSGDKYYDTALAVYTLEQDVSQKTKDWFRKMQTKSGTDKGCWREGDAIRNTAFVLHSVWPEFAPFSPECTSNQTCVSLYNSSYYCSAGSCLKKSEPPGPECTNSTFCQSRYGANYVCTNGNCTINPPQCPTTPCNSTQNCVDGVCVPKDITQQGCTDNTQCVALFGPNWICLQNGSCARQVVQPICGDGNIDQSLNETCDGINININGCSSIPGFNNGTLSCYAPGTAKQCTLNTTGCFNSPVHECNATKPCPSGMQCNLATNKCVAQNNISLCGNGRVDPGEDCDGSVNSSITCSYFRYDGGRLSCYPSNHSTKACKFDVSGCYQDSDECLVNSECVALHGPGWTCGSDNKCKNSTVQTKNCESSGFYCRSREGCSLDSGNEKSGYSCPGVHVCCDEPLTQDNSCEGMSGEVCESNEICDDGYTLPANNLSSSQVCCIDGTCTDAGTGGSYTNCEWFVEGTCKSSCDSSTEEEVDQDCEEGSSNVCCVEKISNGCTKDSDCSEGRLCKDGRCTKPKEKSYLWLWILLILIVFAVLGIVFRERLRPLIMKLKSMLPGSKKEIPRRPGFPPLPGMMSQPQSMRLIPSRPRPILPPQIPRQMPQPPLARVPKPQPPQTPIKEPPKKVEKSKQEKGGELDDVLKKLKEMGK